MSKFNLLEQEEIILPEEEDDTTNNFSNQLTVVETQDAPNPSGKKRKKKKKKSNAQKNTDKQKEILIDVEEFEYSKNAILFQSVVEYYYAHLMIDSNFLASKIPLSPIVCSNHSSLLICFQDKQGQPLYRYLIYKAGPPFDKDKLMFFIVGLMQLPMTPQRSFIPSYIH
jgi:hypothetical protein